jgi:hypothetical protein
MVPRTNSLIERPSSPDDTRPPRMCPAARSLNRPCHAISRGHVRQSSANPVLDAATVRTNRFSHRSRNATKVTLSWRRKRADGEFDTRRRGYSFGAQSRGVSGGAKTRRRSSRSTTRTLLASLGNSARGSSVSRTARPLGNGHAAGVWQDTSSDPSSTTGMSVRTVTSVSKAARAFA